MALDIDKVYRFVQFVANKESRGWVSPEEINIAAELSQIAVYSRIENAFLSNKKIHSDMRPFLRDADVSFGSTSHSFPTAFRQLIRARVKSSGKKISELTQAEYDDAADSTIIPPETAYPACVVKYDGIYVYPDTISEPITVEFLAKLSTVPEWAYTLSSGRPVYDDVLSVDFEFDDNLFQEIATNVLMNVGMNLKDESVTQYGMAFNTQK